MGDTEPDACLVRLSDHALTHLAALTEDEQAVVIENLTSILSDILCYTEAVRMGNLAALLNEMPSISILGDQLMGRKSDVFIVEFDDYKFYLVCVKSRVVVLEFDGAAVKLDEVFRSAVLQ